MKEEALAQWGLSRQKQKNNVGLLLFVPLVYGARAAKVVVQWFCWPPSNGTVINKGLTKGELKFRHEVVVIKIVNEFRTSNTQRRVPFYLHPKTIFVKYRQPQQPPDWIDSKDVELFIYLFIYLFILWRKSQNRA